VAACPAGLGLQRLLAPAEALVPDDCRYGESVSFARISP
jgi:hypothetical protein